MVLVILYIRDLNLKSKNKYSHKVRNLQPMYIYLAWVRNLQSMYIIYLAWISHLEPLKYLFIKKKELSNNI